MSLVLLVFCLSHAWGCCGCRSGVQQHYGYHVFSRPVHSYVEGNRGVAQQSTQVLAWMVGGGGAWVLRVVMVVVEAPCMCSLCCVLCLCVVVHYVAIMCHHIMFDHITFNHIMFDHHGYRSWEAWSQWGLYLQFAIPSYLMISFEWVRFLAQPVILLVFCTTIILIFCLFSQPHIPIHPHSPPTVVV